MSAELKRSLTLYGLVMVAVGSTIGSGIFRTPGNVAASVHLPEWVIALWVLGGIVALTGALTYAEMGSIFPNAGGLYVYLRAAFGDAVAFLYGWFILFGSTAGSIAALSAVCSEHILYLFYGGAKTGFELPLSLGITLFLSFVNIFGVKIGEWIANIFTGAKLLGLLLIIGAGFFFANPGIDAVNQTDTFANTPPDNPWGAFAVAFVGILFSYGGWQHATFMAGETPNPQRNVPRAMVTGALIVTLVYVSANMAYMNLLPVSHIAQSKTVAADALGTIVPWGGMLMAFLIALSTFGTTGIYCMTAPRIYYAMAKDGIFFKRLAEIHPRWRTPVNAILAQGAFSIVLLLFWGTFENLIEYVTFVDWIFLMLAGASVFVLRKKMPEAPRAYKTLGYPVTPAIFVSICLWFICFMLVEKPVRTGAGLLVVGIGYLVYLFYFRKKDR